MTAARMLLIGCDVSSAEQMAGASPGSLLEVSCLVFSVWCFVGEFADGSGDPWQHVRVSLVICINFMARADAECLGNRELNLSGKSMRMMWRSISMIWGRISVFVVARDETMVCRKASLSSSSSRCSGTSTTLMLWLKAMHSSAAHLPRNEMKRHWNTLCQLPYLGTRRFRTEMFGRDVERRERRGREELRGRKRRKEEEKEWREEEKEGREGGKEGGREGDERPSVCTSEITQRNPREMRGM